MSASEFRSRIVFTSDGTAKTYTIGFVPTRVLVENLSKLESPVAGATVVRSRWDEAVGNSTTFTESTTAAAGELDTGTLTSGGISVRTGREPLFGNRIDFTAFTKASGAVLTLETGHGIAVQDIVTILSAANANQVEGMSFSVTAVSATSITLGQLNSTAFAGTLGAGAIRKMNFPSVAQPSINFVSAVSTTNATRPVFTLTVSLADTRFSVGQIISFGGFDTFGMAGLNDMNGEITAINATANTITVDVNVSGLGVFAFPATGDAKGQRPHIYPQGQRDTTQFDSTFQSSMQPMITFGTGVVGVTGDIIVARAERVIF